MNVSIGTCGLCGGRVSVPANWMGLVPPTPTCEQCGAVQKNAHGPVLDMERGRTWTSPTIIVTDKTGET